MNVDQLINAVTRVKAELPDSLRRSGHNVFIRLLAAGALRQVVMGRLQLIHEVRERGSALQRKASCRVCGCTEDDCGQCVEETGEACHWVEPYLCSRCAADISKLNKATGKKKGRAA